MDGATQATARPLAIIANDTASLGKLEATYPAATVCYHDYSFADMPLPNGQSFRVKVTGKDDCNERTNVQLSTTTGDHAGWFGIFPDDAALLTLATPSLAAEPRAVSTLASDDMKTATTGDLDSPMQPFYAKHLTGHPHLYFAEAGAGTYEGAGLVKIKGPDMHVSSREGTADYATGESAQTTPTGARQLVMRWVSVEPHAPGTLAWDSPARVHIAVSEAPSLAFDGTLRTTPTAGSLRAGLREYDPTGEPATIEGRFTGMLVPTDDARGITVDLAGDLRSTSLAPRPAPVLGSSGSFPWALVLVGLAVVASGGAAVVAIRRHRQDPKEKHARSLIAQGRQALQEAEAPTGERDFTRAIGFFEEATQLAPHLGEAWLGLGYAHYYAERYAEGLQAFTRARPLLATGEAELMAALCLAALGEGESASEWLLQALRAKDLEMETLAAIRDDARLKAMLDTDPALKVAYDTAADHAMNGFGKHRADRRA